MATVDFKGERAPEISCTLAGLSSIFIEFSSVPISNTRRSLESSGRVVSRETSMLRGRVYAARGLISVSYAHNS